MRYGELVDTLQALERRWRRGGCGAVPSVAEHPCYALVRGGEHNLQYFACSEHSAGDTAGLPVIIAVGINYTQRAEKIPDERETLSSHGAAAPRVDDDLGYLLPVVRAWIESFRTSPEAWKSHRRPRAAQSLESPSLAPVCGGRPFHLVLTNLTPWITTASWTEKAEAWEVPRGDLKRLQKALLDRPPYVPALSDDPLAHLRDLKGVIGEAVTLWVFHGLEALESRMPSLPEALGISNWLFTSNISETTQRPVVKDGVIKFQRVKKSAVLV